MHVTLLGLLRGSMDVDKSSRIKKTVLIDDMMRMIR